MRSPVRLLHASDVHVDNGPDGTAGIERVVAAALAHEVDVVLLVGDTFDDSRVRDDVVAAFVGHLDRIPVPVVVLPGNHDPLLPGGIYDRTPLPDHVVLLTDGDGHTVVLPELGLELWGRPHVSFADLRPLDGLPPRGEQPWQVALAHGHLVRSAEDHHRAYLITSEEIAACDRDYLALGHWDVPHDVSAGDVVAWYSGSPKRFAACALVTLTDDGGRDVRVESLRLP